jgi:hypothetical protein
MTLTDAGFDLFQRLTARTFLVLDTEYTPDPDGDGDRLTPSPSPVSCAASACATASCTGR